MTATLQPEQTADRFVRYRRDGDRELRNSLVVEYGWLAHSCARRFAGRGEPFDDLLQVAQLGVLKAVERYDPDYGVPFAGFAMPTVLGELRRHFRDRTWAVSPPRRVKELAVELSDVVRLLEQRLGRAPASSDIAQYLRLSEEEIVQAMAARRSYRLVPLVALSGDDEPAHSTADVDSDSRADAVTVRRALQTLAPADRRMLVWSYYEGMTQSEIGRHLGVSQAQVSRRLRELLDQLRPTLAA
jgi:RNA polymerase sigma-B factor